MTSRRVTATWRLVIDAVSVVLFICVLLLCLLAVKGFRVDLASGTDSSGGKKQGGK